MGIMSTLRRPPADVAHNSQDDNCRRSFRVAVYDDLSVKLWHAGPGQKYLQR